MFNNSLIASIHNKLITWCSYYYSFNKFLNTKVQIKNKKKLTDTKILLERLIGEDNMKFISERYHAEMAIDHYRSARQTHSEGIAYKHLIENMSFLNDDFSDKLSHFYTSLERYNLRNGGIKDDVKKLKKFAVSTNLYKTTYHTIDPLNYNLILENEDN